MSLRETLAANQTLILVVAVIALVASAALIRYVATDDGTPGATGKAFYSVDDGESYFVDEADRISGFLVEGQTAYRAYVFRTGGGEAFVGYLERFTPEAREAAIRVAADAVPTSVAPRGGPTRNTSLVKKPGDATWTPRSSPGVSRVLRIQPPAGEDGLLEPVLPD